MKTGSGCARLPVMTKLNTPIEDRHREIVKRLQHPPLYVMRVLENNDSPWRWERQLSSHSHEWGGPGSRSYLEEMSLD